MNEQVRNEQQSSPISDVLFTAGMHSKDWEGALMNKALVSLVPPRFSEIAVSPDPQSYLVPLEGTGTEPLVQTLFSPSYLPSFSQLSRRDASLCF